MSQLTDSTRALLLTWHTFSTDYEKVIQLAELLKKEGSPDLNYDENDINTHVSSLALLIAQSGCEMGGLSRVGMKFFIGAKDPAPRVAAVKKFDVNNKSGLLFQIDDGETPLAPDKDKLLAETVYWYVPAKTSLYSSLRVIVSTCVHGKGDQYVCLDKELTGNTNFLCIKGEQVGKVIQVELTETKAE